MVANGLHRMATASVSCNDCVIAPRLRAGIVGERFRPRAAALGTGIFRPVAVAQKGALERLDKGFGPQKHPVLYLFPGGRLIGPVGDQAPVTQHRRCFGGAECCQQPVPPQPVRAIRLTDGGPITAPWPLAGGAHHPGTHRVEYDVPGQRQQLAVFLNNDCRVAALEDMSAALVEVVAALRVDRVEVPHPLGQIALRCLDQEMVEIRQQAEGMDPPIEPFTHLRQQGLTGWLSPP